MVENENSSTNNELQGFPRLCLVETKFRATFGFSTLLPNKVPEDASSENLLDENLADTNSDDR